MVISSAAFIAVIRNSTLDSLLSCKVDRTCRHGNKACALFGYVPSCDRLVLPFKSSQNAMMDSRDGQRH
jgi:hypothetical protein